MSLSFEESLKKAAELEAEVVMSTEMNTEEIDMLAAIPATMSVQTLDDTSGMIAAYAGDM